MMKDNHIITPDKAARIAENAKELYEALRAKRDADGAVYALLVDRHKEWHAATAKARKVLRTIEDDS